MFDWIQVGIGLIGALGLLLAGIGVLAIARRSGKASGRSGDASEVLIDVSDLGKQLHKRADAIRAVVLSKSDLKAFQKEQKQQKKDEKGAKSAEANRGRAYVLNFHGDVQASQTHALSEAISALVPLLRKDKDSVILRLESPGGVVHGYGLAAAQVLRLKSAVRKLTICVDKIAASGGYMMACLGHEIVASPFAIVGSIGAVAGVPNFNRLIKDNKVDYFEMTAGKYKRTLSVLGEVTDDKLQKFQEQLEDVHAIFKDHVQRERPTLDMDRVGTGEYWYGVRALELGLVDRLSTSDEVIALALVDNDVFEVTAHEKESLRSKFLGRFLGAVQSQLARLGLGMA
jgi:serine protease SohB